MVKSAQCLGTFFSMAPPSRESPRLRFDAFEVNPQTGKLLKAGIPIKLSPQPFKVLLLLLEQPGEVVDREKIRQHLWGDSTFVDFERGINLAINQIRGALSDDAEKPRYIETLPKIGYRFVSTVSKDGFNRLPQIRAVSPAQVYEWPSEQPVIPASQHLPEDGCGNPIHKKVDRFGVSNGTVGSSKKVISRKLLYGVALFAGILLLASLISVLLRHQHPARQRALTRVTFDAGLQTGATWSPDGRFIAYSSNRGGKFDIWVQSVSGGDSVKITHEPGQNWQPEWSPDGKYIAYRAEYGAGGLYIVPALGGARRKIVDFGYYPRWSPDSSHIMFLPTTYGGVRSLYAVSLDGGLPYEVLAEFFLKHPNVTGSSAAWHPDGKRISVYVWDYERMVPVFWTVPLNGGEALKSEIDPELLKRLGDRSSGRFVADASFSWAPSGDAIYFEGTLSGATNLWKMTVDSKTLRATGMERLTTGPGHDTGLAITADGKKLAFSGESRQIQIWAAPFDPRSGKLTGKGEAVTSPGIEAGIPSLTPDGEELAFSGNRGGNWQIWQRSMVSGEVTPITGDDAYTRAYPVWSPEGTSLAYVRFKKRGAENKIVVWSAASKEEQVIADGGDYDLYGWAPGGSELVVAKWNKETTKAEVWLLSLSTGSCTEKIAASPDYFLFQGQFSPDGRWVAFEAVRDVSNGRESSIYVVSAHGRDWIRITDGRQWDDKPRWSPDGRTIYFVSGRGGFYNVWGTHFDPINGRAVGIAFRLTNFDNPALTVPIYIPDVGLSIAQRRLALTVSQSSGGIWMLDNVDR